MFSSLACGDVAPVAGLGWAACRFGADAVFRCKDTVMTDQDLDAVLERGAKKTQEMQAKLNVAEKGDMLDFSFDDGTGVQV